MAKKKRRGPLRKASDALYDQIYSPCIPIHHSEAITKALVRFLAVYNNPKVKD